jgi:hypothetical protein
MKTVKEFINAIRDEKEGFSFGKPWRFDEKALTAILPILRESKAKRKYLVLAEAKKVRLEDTGNIDSILVTNNEEKPVFIRAGNIFKGKTQERAATISRVIMPGKTEKIDVVCIHASRPISSGVEVKSAGVTPRSIDLSSQNEAWDSAQTFCSMSMSVSASLGSSINNGSGGGGGKVEYVKVDDIATNLETFSKAIESVLKKVPFTKNQVGVVLLDTKGCAGLEAFDLSVSWKAIKEDIVRREGEKIAEIDKDNVFEYKPKKAKDQAKKSLAGNFKEQPLYGDNDTQIFKISRGDFVGEVTLLGNKVIHLNLTKGVK